MHNIVFLCGECKNILTTPLDSKSIKCLFCGTKSAVPVGNMVVKCPDCESLMIYSTDDFGKMINCFKCDHRFIIDPKYSTPYSLITSIKQQDKPDESSSSDSSDKCPTCDKALDAHGLCLACEATKLLKNTKPQTYKAIHMGKSWADEPEEPHWTVKYRKHIIAGFAVLVLLIWIVPGKKKEVVAPVLVKHETQDLTIKTIQIVEKTPEELDADRILLWKQMNKGNYDLTMSHVRGGRYNDAFQSWARYHSEINEYLSNNVPAANIGSLELKYTCGACSNGICTNCQGNQSCPACSGSGTNYCVPCKGVGQIITRCTNCICQECRGQRGCKACYGYGKLRCLTCRGTGQGKQELVESACTRCGGSGSIKFVNTSGRCTVCRGTGKTYKNHTPPCSVCSGTGRIVCKDCNGSGKCTKCGGRGVMSGCQFCQGTLKISNVCEVCNGDPTCKVCKGGKQCMVCQGSGKCLNKDCYKGIVSKWEYPVDNRVFVQPCGIILYSAEDNKIVYATTNMEELVTNYNGSTFTVSPSNNALVCISMGTNDFKWVGRMVFGE